ncbi:DinB family protein [Thalassoglobus sp. JC818]|uniref:DinB family protein n=1 Tax=Thalassoglobus sp. JC818 TaxID=3232136 RepID=UPI0034576CF3
MNSYSQLIEDYLAGPQELRRAVEGMTTSQLDAAPVQGAWSSRQVVCHIADFETVYADRMKRVIAEDRPPLRGGDPDLFATRLAYHDRDVEVELTIVDFTRQQMAEILRKSTDEDFQRVGLHSDDGPLTLKVLLERIVSHIPHHVRFIDEKRKLLNG